MTLSDVSPALNFAEMQRTSLEGVPPFPAPWAAEAFALTVHLHERGVFTWSQWAEALSTELRKPEKSEDGSDYYRSWADALCNLLGSLDILQPAEVTAMQERWQRAAEATPHGKPILLENADPFSASFWNLSIDRKILISSQRDTKSGEPIDR